MGKDYSLWPQTRRMRLITGTRLEEYVVRALDRSLFRSSCRRRRNGALQVFQQSGHRQVVVFLPVLGHARRLDVFVYGPQRDVRLGINEDQLELSHEYRPLVLFGEADLKHEVCVAGSGRHFISPPALHGRIELVVRPVWAAAVRDVLGLMEEGFFYLRWR